MEEPADVPVEGRRAEDRIREEHHDARAKTVFANKPVEQRERRDAQVRERREEQKRQWDGRRRTDKNKKPLSPRTRR